MPVADWQLRHRDASDRRLARRPTVTSTLVAAAAGVTLTPATASAGAGAPAVPRWPAIVDHGRGGTVIFGANAVCLYLALHGKTAAALLPDPTAAEGALDVEEFHMTPLAAAAAGTSAGQAPAALTTLLDRLEVASTTATACLQTGGAPALGGYVWYPVLARALALPAVKSKARKMLTSVVEAVAKSPVFAAASAAATAATASAGAAAGAKKGGKGTEPPVLVDVDVSPYKPAAGPAPLPNVDFAALGLLSSLKVCLCLSVSFHPSSLLPYCIERVDARVPDTAVSYPPSLS